MQITNLSSVEVLTFFIISNLLLHPVYLNLNKLFFYPLPFLLFRPLLFLQNFNRDHLIRFGFDLVLLDWRQFLSLHHRFFVYRVIWDVWVVRDHGFSSADFIEDLLQGGLTYGVLLDIHGFFLQRIINLVKEYYYILLKLN